MILSKAFLLYRHLVKHASSIKGVVHNWAVFRTTGQSATSLGQFEVGQYFSISIDATRESDAAYDKAHLTLRDQ